MTFLIFPLLFLCISAVNSGKMALIIIDVQNCFLPGGSLQVTDGQKVIPIINKIRTEFEHDFSLVVLSQDWHCRNHVSFASQHQGKKPYDHVSLQYDKNGHLCFTNTCNNVQHTIDQVLWPHHCIINTTDANFSTDLVRKESDLVIRKGYHCNIDSYSAFYDNGGFSHTELNAKLKEHGITTVFITGLALDYCVYYTAKDADKLGYITFLVQDASRGVANATVAKALDDLNDNTGVSLIQTTDVGDVIDRVTSGGIAASVRNMVIGLCLIINRSLLRHGNKS